METIALATTITTTEDSLFLLAGTIRIPNRPLSVAETVRLTGLGKSAVYDLISSGTLRKYKRIPLYRVLVDPRSVVELLA